jgi:hypothetical protein
VVQAKNHFDDVKAKHVAFRRKSKDSLACNHDHVSGLSELALLRKTTKHEAQWAEPVPLKFHSALRKLNTEPPIGVSHQVLVIWLSSYREEHI